MKTRWRQILAGLLTEGVRAGIYRSDIDPEAFASIMIATFIGFCRNPEKDAARFDRLIGELRRSIQNPAHAAPADLSNPAGGPRHRGDTASKE
jgi:hypothetical protein